MDASSVKNLLNNYLEGKSSAEELVQLRELLSLPENRQLVDETLLQAFNNTYYQEAADYPAAEMAAVLMQRALETRKPALIYMRRITAAAVVIAIAAAIWLFGPRPAVTTKVKDNTVAHLTPGGNKATLTLADGTAIVLDSAANGLLSNQQGIRVIKLKSGQLSYQNGKGDIRSDVPVWNTLSTPRGGQYQLTLPDGTQVWLNAASSIRYPVAFNSQERKVEVTGEVYFEVAKEVARPFRVSSGAEQVEVLGTSFNMMAYHDEPAMQTTLIDGKIKVSAPASGNIQPVVLSPGQQAQTGTAAFAVREVDGEQVVAWVHGNLSMKYQNVAALMRQISRWYDIDVVFEGPVPEMTFSGSFSRMVNLNQVLEALNGNGIHASVENGKLIVRRN